MFSDKALVSWINFSLSIIFEDTDFFQQSKSVSATDFRGRLNSMPSWTFWWRELFTCMSSFISCTWHKTNLKFSLLASAKQVLQIGHLYTFFPSCTDKMCPFSSHLLSNFHPHWAKFCVKVSSLRVLWVCNSNSFLGHDLLRIRSG